MSQEKIDKRKQSKGEMLHNVKKQMRMTTLIVAAVLIAAGVFSSVVCYNNGYKKGEVVGEQQMYNWFQLMNSLQTQTTGNGQTNADGETGSSGETKPENETKPEDTTTAADK